MNSGGRRVTSRLNRCGVLSEKEQRVVAWGPRTRQRSPRASRPRLQISLAVVRHLLPEVLVATAAEQWLSARQSVEAFFALGYPGWTIRHGFFADMGGIVIAPLGCEPFPIDSQQPAYLVKNKHMEMPEITVDDVTSVDKANGLARFVTLLQMGWFCVSCIARGAGDLAFSTLEVTTLAFILCTLHTFFF